MKKQKHTIYVILMLLLFMACSKDNLNVDFPKQPEDQFFTDEQKLDRGIRGVYAQLTDLYSFGGMTCVYPLYLLPSDEFTQEAGGSNNDIDNFKGFNSFARLELCILEPVDAAYQPCQYNARYYGEEQRSL